MKKWIFLFFISSCFFAQAQIDFSAQEVVPPYQETFGYGTNMGVYSGWSDQALASLAAGNPSIGLPGAGCNTLRPFLPEKFVEYWGYDIRVDAFQHYDQIGIRDNTVFIGYPSPEHRDTTHFCSGVQSELFANMYLDIWDNGENGTPVNDDNYYALYVYKLVTLYGPYTRFWEIWNEPDLENSQQAELEPGEPLNWWENVPEPCDYTLRAPIFHYIRLLRISYEVIKSVDPDAYIAIGGIGFPSFLDLVLRHSDNPEDGSLNDSFPLLGGAYFDVVSYHSYPHYDGSMRYWSDAIGGFAYTRHSDAAVAGLLRRKNEMHQVLINRGYDGSVYPEKLWIVTESNIPSAEFGNEYYGSEEAQRNYLMKAAVQCQKNDIVQLHVYKIGEDKPRNQATQEFDRMGLFQNMGNVSFDEVIITESGIGYRTLQETIGTARYHADRTAAMQIPSNADGAAFQHPDGHFTYVLWAKTQVDNTENAGSAYNFPPEWNISHVTRKEWNYAETQELSLIPSQNIPLQGAPIVLEATTPVNTEDLTSLFQLQAHPNPYQDSAQLQFSLPSTSTVSIQVSNQQGQVIYRLEPGVLAAGAHQISLSERLNSKGIYYVQLTANQQTATIKLVKQ